MMSLPVLYSSTTPSTCYFCADADAFDTYYVCHLESGLPTKEKLCTTCAVAAHDELATVHKNALDMEEYGAL